jgi:hypothetical protein
MIADDTYYVPLKWFLRRVIYLYKYDILLRGYSSGVFLLLYIVLSTCFLIGQEHANNSYNTGAPAIFPAETIICRYYL